MSVIQSVKQGMWYVSSSSVSSSAIMARLRLFVLKGHIKATSITMAVPVNCKKRTCVMSVLGKSTIQRGMSSLLYSKKSG